MHLHPSYVFTVNISGPIIYLVQNLVDVVLYQIHILTLYFVTGKIDLKDWYCFTARSSDTLCGTSGKYFEPLDTLDRLH
jgi:hypothetical protein